MPVTTEQQVQNSNMVPPKKHKSYKGVFVIGAGLALIIIVPFLIFWGGVWGDTGGMGKYLQDKYGQEFKVKYLEDRAVTIGDPGQRVDTAYPVNDSSLTFEVGKDRTTGVYFDGYSGAVWAREERPRVAAFLQTVYGASTTPNFDLTTHIPTPAAPDPIKGEVPSINDAMARYKDNFFYSLTVKLTTDHTLSQSEIEDHTAKIKQIVDFVLAKNISSPAVRYAINIEGQDNSYLCNLFQNELTDQNKVNNCLTDNHGKAW
jgi:hypothetical protein